MFFHLRQRHHPAATVPALFFVLLVFLLGPLHFSFINDVLGTAVCALLSNLLARVLVAEVDAPENSALLE